MPTAEIITIGTEILLGEIVDTNTRHIARVLRENGIDIYRTSSIGDNVARIAETLREAMARAEIIITTGGLGPTVDDPTREAVARAFGVQTEFREELWQQVIERFASFHRYPSENNRRQAYVPVGAKAIENPVGTAPAFFMEWEHGVVACLPGVPREMAYLLEKNVLPYLRQRFALNSVLKVRILHTAGVGESAIDERIGDLEKLNNPTVGLAAHAGQVDVRITAKAPSEAEALAHIEEVEREVRRRLGDWVYGADDESLSLQAVERLRARGWRLTAVEAGLEGKFIRQLAAHEDIFCCGQVFPSPPDEPGELLSLTAGLRQAHQAEVGIGLALYPKPEQSVLHLVLITPEKEKTMQVPFGGPPGLAQRRAVNLGLDTLRKLKPLQG